MEKISWQARTDDGCKVIYEASYFGKWWQLTCTPKVSRSQKGEVESIPVEFTRETWEELHDVLVRKYQRRRVAWNVVQHVEDILAGKTSNQCKDQRHPHE